MDQLANEIYKYIAQQEAPVPVKDILGYLSAKTDRRTLNQILIAMTRDGDLKKQLKDGKAYYTAPDAENQKLLNRISEKIDEIEAMAKDTGLDLHPSNIGDTGFDMYRWTFTKGTRKSGDGWSVAIPDGFSVIDSEDDRPFEAVPQGKETEKLDDRRVQILPGKAYDFGAIQGEKWSYHLQARKGRVDAYAATMAQFYNKNMGAFMDLPTDGFSVVTEDVCASVLMQDTSGGSFSYLIQMLTEGKSQTLRVQTSFMTQEQKEQMTQSVTEWVKTFRFDKPNPAIPKKAPLSDPGILTQLKNGFTSAFDKKVDLAVEEAKYGLVGQIALQKYRVEQDLVEGDGSADVQAAMDSGMESTAYYTRMADELVTKAEKGKLPAKTMQHIYKKLQDLIIRMDNLRVNGTLIQCHVPGDIEKIWEKWVSAEETAKQQERREQEAAREKARQEQEARRAQEEAKKAEEANRKAREEARRAEEAARKAAEEKRKMQEEAKAFALNAERLRNRCAIASGMISSSYYHVVAVRQDGTVIAKGKNDKGQCNVSNWRNVVAVACNWDSTAAVTADGRVLYAGDNSYNQAACTAWRNIKAVAIGYGFVVGLKKDGTVVATAEGQNGRKFSKAPDVNTWRNIQSIRIDSNYVIGIDNIGRVLCLNRNSYGRCDSIYEPYSRDAVYYRSDPGIVLYKDGSCEMEESMVFQKEDLAGINKHKNILTVCYCTRPLALLANGKIIVEPCREKTSNIELQQFIEKYKLKNVVGVSDEHGLLFLTNDGRVFGFHAPNECGIPDGEIFGSGVRLFSDFHKWMDEQDAEKERIRREQEELEKKRKAEEALRAERRKKGLCQHCGSEFKKVLFGMKCAKCSIRKDY